MNAFFIATIVKNNIETPRHGNDQLRKCLVGVPASLRPPGHVIEVIDALDLEGHMPAGFDKCQVSLRVKDLREINQSTLVKRKIHFRSYALSISRAGLPTTVARARTSLVTTAPAPILAPSPIRTPGSMHAPPPMLTLFSTTVPIGSKARLPLPGYLSLVKVTFGPIKTSLPMRRPSQSCTPLLIVTRSPTTTSFSMKQCEQMLQLAPNFAPERTTTNCQMRVPGPMAADWTSASG